MMCARAIDEGSIKAIRGARVVREKDFVAVVAPREWDAILRERGDPSRLHVLVR